MKKFTLLFLFISTLLLSQSPGDKWYFGANAGINFTGAPTAITSSGINASEGTASIADAFGNLLFYTDGITVWNKNNIVMTNGTGLMGNQSSTQAALIVPTPSNTNQYYIFTTDAQFGPNGLRYSMVDMSMSGGLGSVTTKNTLLLTPVTEKLAAVKDIFVSANRYWILAHGCNNNNFYAYELNSSGLQTPVISTVGIVHRANPSTNAIGQMKISSCGGYLALAGGTLDTVQVFSFNQNNGVVMSPTTIPIGSTPYGIEMSAEPSKKLYISTSNTLSSLVQYDMAAGSQSAIIASKITISASPTVSALQLERGGKIYVANYMSNFVGVINNPSGTGASCNYGMNAINLDPLSSGNKCMMGLPSFAIAPYFSCGLSGISEQKNKKENSSIYPNPSTNEFNLKVDDVSFVEIYSHTGALIEKFKVEGNNFSFGKSYSAGIYFVRINNEITLKVIKE